MIGKHSVILTQKELGLCVVLTQFGLHVEGKNGMILASKFNKMYINWPLGPLQAQSEKMIEGVVNRDYSDLDKVYFTNAKGA
jgi:hypothetical protein